MSKPHRATSRAAPHVRFPSPDPCDPADDRWDQQDVTVGVDIPPLVRHRAPFGKCQREQRNRGHAQPQQGRRTSFYRVLRRHRRRPVAGLARRRVDRRQPPNPYARPRNGARPHPWFRPCQGRRQSIDPCDNCFGIGQGDREVVAVLGADAGSRAGVRTTGRAIAIASRTLFCTPRAISNGATTMSADWRNGRTSGTSPRSARHGHRASLSGRGLVTVHDMERARACARRKRGMISSIIQSAAAILGA